MLSLLTLMISEYPATLSDQQMSYPLTPGRFPAHHPLRLSGNNSHEHASQCVLMAETHRLMIIKATATAKQQIFRGRGIRKALPAALRKAPC